MESFFACWFHHFIPFFHSQFVDIYFVQIYVFVHRTFQSHSLSSLKFVFRFGFWFSCLCVFVCVRWPENKKKRNTHAHKSLPLPRTRHSINLVAMNWTTATTTNYNLKQRKADCVFNLLELTWIGAMGMQLIAL